MKILNKEVREYIGYKIEKYDEEEFNESDLQQITDLCLNNVNFLGEKLEIDLFDIIKLPNLEILTLQYFVINDEIVDILNQCSNLRVLHLISCELNNKKILNNATLESLLISTSKIEGDININFPEIVEIIDNQIIDLKFLVQKQQIKKLFIHNCNIKNFENIHEFRGLESLNLDGSTIDDIKSIEQIKKHIPVSIKEKYLPVK